ncbi:MAG TPA: ribosome small subunit-dependent GTPase A [Defluviitaleaceae bacterium]|nr:ribosome small subunit-dependent GTPase A [Defluviitaleaceae bacterium]HPT76140.1 ribosome small subunit-dependent GTPase A [Defluviitaleaceae bacterium]
MVGTIVKGIAGFYYVRVDDKVYECKAKGKFRNINLIPYVGDKAEITLLNEENRGSIVNILPRKNYLIRPPVANVDQAVIVFAVKNPNVNLQLLDRFLILAEEQGLEIVICFNKIDLEEEKVCKELAAIYKKAGYKTILSSTVSNEGILELKEALADKTTVFAGPSGVGKSSLLNAIDTSLKLATGMISEKIKRGKHTTRHVELLPLDNGGFVLDTPGFSSLSLSHLDSMKLQDYYREFVPYNNACKFIPCSHIHEPQCKIKEMVEEGLIDFERYQRYKSLYNELESNEQRRWKK